MQEGFALHEVILNEKGEPIDYRFLEVNPAFEKITGLKAKEIKNKRVKEVLPGTEDYWIKSYGDVVLNNKSMTFSNYSRELDKYFSVNVYSPAPNQFATIFTDITIEKKAQEKINEERKLFETTINSIGDGVISTDINGNIKIMNRVAEQLTGWTISEAKGRSFQEVFNIINEKTGQKCCDPLVKVIQEGKTIELENHTLLIKKNKDRISIEDSAAPVIDENGNIKGAVIVFRDNTEKKERLERIEFLSYHDQLTGLYNRHFFEEEVKRLDVQRNLPITIAMLDVNGLKMVNDVFGHEAGDELLIKTAKVLKRECRSEDIISRFGGDEFVVLLPETSYEQTELIISRIQKALEDERNGKYVVSLSAGWATKTDVSQDKQELLSAAEDSMYRKKIIESQKMRIETIDLILENFHKLNPEEKIHSEKVSEICKDIGRKMNLDAQALLELEVAGYMHDIGKSTVKRDLLYKTGKLTESEIEEIKMHSEIGYRILKAADLYSGIAEHILSHHEWWNGKGYPRGLSNEGISLAARILAVAEAYQYMIEERTFKEAYTHERAVEELKKWAGTQFDPEIVKYFVN